MSIMLSFGGTTANGAWDDRELVNAYDTAMEEFHAHHPGPGSWLDKVTAQAALQGQAGPSTQLNPAWYTASEILPDIDRVAVAEVPQSRPKKRPKNRDHHPRLSDPRPPNPYISTSAASHQADGSPASPQYSPPSPNSPGRSHADRSTSASLPLLEAESEDEVPAMADATASAVQQYPSPPAPMSIAPTTAVSATDALSYAMTSQYWAGYWMGVSQALQHADDRSPANVRPTIDQELNNSEDPSKRSNTTVSKHRVLKR